MSNNPILEQSTPSCMEDGVIYELSDDKSFASVVDYTGANQEIFIASEYQGAPVVEIKKHAFKEKSFSSITIPDSVITVAERAFFRCDGLTEIHLNAQTVEKLSFCECNSLTTVFIGNKTNFIGLNAFYYCRGLTDIIVDEENANYRTIDGVLYSKDLTMIYCYPPNKPDRTFTVRDEVTTVCLSAFSRSRHLEKVIMGDGVTQIDACAFDEGESLEEVILSKNLVGISSYAFAFCPKLLSIEIPSKVREIGSSAFNGCESLENVVIGESVEKINMRAFESCNNLKSAVFKRPQNWKARRNLFTVAELTDTKKSAEYLRDTYTFAIWTKV